MDYPITSTDVRISDVEIGDVVRIQWHDTLHVVTAIELIDRGEYDDYRISVVPGYGLAEAHDIEVQWDGAPTVSDQPWISEVHSAARPLMGEIAHPLVGDHLDTDNDDLCGEVMSVLSTPDTLEVTLSRWGELSVLRAKHDGSLIGDQGGRVTYLLRAWRAIDYPCPEGYTAPAQYVIEPADYDPSEIEEDDE